MKQTPVVFSFVDKMRNLSVLLQVWRKGNEISEQCEHATQHEEQERVQNLCMYNQLTKWIQNVARCSSTFFSTNPTLTAFRRFLIATPTSFQESKMFAPPPPVTMREPKWTCYTAQQCTMFHLCVISETHFFSRSHTTWQSFNQHSRTTQSNRWTHTIQSLDVFGNLNNWMNLQKWWSAMAPSAAEVAI